MFGVNPYNPYGYPMPFNGQSPGQNQPPFQQQGMQQASPAQQGGPDWIQVPELKQVEQVQVQPGGKSWVMVQNEPVFALRVADQMGLVTTSYYRFAKIEPTAMTVGATPQDFVTRSEFEQLVQSLSVPTDKPKKEEGMK